MGYIKAQRKAIESMMNKVLPGESAAPRKLHKTMRYTTLSGGKRIRAIMCVASAEAAGGSARKALYPAIAVEFLHAYTLVHNDLPCMDDDDTRRDKPSCHVAFDPATAILAGDALQALAFETAAMSPGLPYRIRCRIVSELAHAAGSLGVVGGQIDDLRIASACRKPTAQEIRTVHLRKTAALFVAAARMGAISADAPPPILSALTSYASNFGLAFQIVDDISDDPSRKPETRLDKSSCLLVYGHDGAQRKATVLIKNALLSLKTLGAGPAAPLTGLAQMLAQNIC